MSRTAQQVLQEEFLVARAKILELAAILDRIDRSSQEPNSQSADALRESNSQMQLLLEAMTILQDLEPDRAARVQQLMSRPYDPTWRKQWNI